MSNFKPVKTHIEGFTFDSALEAQAYRLLCTAFGRDKIFPHPTINLRNDKYAHFLPNLNHKSDFLVNSQAKLLYVEVKGTLNGNFKGRAEYIRNLQMIMDMDINYCLWVGDGILAFDGKETLPFAYVFPGTLGDVSEILHDIHSPEGS